MSKDKKPTNPSSGNGSAPAGDAKKSCCPADFKLSPCRIVKVNGTLEISATELPDFPGGNYEWMTESGKITLQNSLSSTVTVKAGAAPGSGRDSEVITVTRTASGCDPVVKQVKVTVAKMTFSASPTQRYGYDDFDTPANHDDDHLCIKKSDWTTLHVNIEGGAVATDFDFVADAPVICTVRTPGAFPSCDLILDATAEDKKETTLRAKVKCPSKAEFAKIQVHVYKERAVDVVVAKIDKTAAGPNMRFPTADYASHQNDANAKLKEAVVKYNITNFDPDNKVTPVNLASGTSTLTYDIKAGGGADLTAISTAMSGTGTKVRVAIVRGMRSVYYLKNAVHAGDTTIELTAAASQVYYAPSGYKPPLDTGANQEIVNITAVAGATLTVTALTKDHAAGTAMEFNAAGWGSDPIIIVEGETAALSVAKWTVLHEVGHRDKGLNLRDIIDATDFMHYSQGWTDYRLRYCPRRKNYPPGTADTENQWETIPRN